MKPAQVKTEISVQELKNLFNKNGYSAKRIETVILATESKMKRKDIAVKLGVHRNRVTRWIHIFNEKGIDGLKNKKIGRPPIITKDCKKFLKEALSQEPKLAGLPHNKWSAKAVRLWITKNCSQNCSMPEAYKILKELR